MPNEHAANAVREASVSAVVVRCGCGDPDAHNGVRDGKARPCPRPRAVEDRGVVSYWHRRWWRRLFFRLTGRVP